jgi:hypothetical protein
VSSRAAGTFAAGQVIPVRIEPHDRSLDAMNRVQLRGERRGGCGRPAAGDGRAVRRLVATCSLSMFDSATVPNRVRSLTSCVPIATTATVVTNRARTRPLTARKAALGSSAMRRAAISVPARPHGGL